MNEKYFIEFAKKPDGSEVKHHLTLTLSRKLAKISPEDLDKLLNMDGLDEIRPCGQYSFEILLARTFDLENLIQNIERIALEIQSDLILDTKIET
jgi:hypothetical protein